MSSGMPEIGSRISLISNADIRYEGKLFAVDPEECTIALSSVRSYGTEDRSAKYAVPAQNQVYDYILFRGSDIKDIRVLTTTIPNDPAIVQLSVPPSISDSQFQVRSNNFQSSMMMPNAPSTSRNQPPYQNTSYVSGNSGNVNTAPKSQTVNQNVSEDESRSSTPSTQNATSHKNSSSVRLPTSTNKIESEQNNNQPQRKQNSYGNRDLKSGHTGNRYQQYVKPQYPQQKYQQPRYPQQQQQRFMHQSQYRDYRDNQFRNYADFRDQYVARHYTQQLRNGQRNENWNSNYGMNNRRNVRTNQPPGVQQNYQSAYQNQSRKPKNTLKFDEDYDFEQANSEFESVRSQLAKTKIDDTPKLNGDVESKKEDSGNENSGEENDVENEEKQVFYDKVKSFFDQISYEAIERSKGHTQRLDWKTERKINSETFGSVALRRNNANFRSRTGAHYFSYSNRNPAVNNNYRPVYRSQGNQNNRRQYNPVNKKSSDSMKGNQSA